MPRKFLFHLGLHLITLCLQPTLPSILSFDAISIYFSLIQIILLLIEFHCPEKEWLANLNIILNLLGITTTFINILDSPSLLKIAVFSINLQCFIPSLSRLNNFIASVIYKLKKTFNIPYYSYHNKCAPLYILL